MLALLPWLNNWSKQVHVMFLSICSNSRVWHPILWKLQTDIMLNNPLQPPHKDEHSKTKPPVSVGMCRCQLPAQKKPPENERLHFHQKRRNIRALQWQKLLEESVSPYTQSNNCSLMLITMIIGPSAKGPTTSNGLQYDSPSGTLAIVTYPGE